MAQGRVAQGLSLSNGKTSDVPRRISSCTTTAMNRAFSADALGGAGISRRGELNLNAAPLALSRYAKRLRGVSHRSGRRSATTSLMRDAASGSTESRPTKKLNMPEQNPQQRGLLQYFNSLLSSDFRTPNNKLDTRRETDRDSIRLRHPVF